MPVLPVLLPALLVPVESEHTFTMMGALERCRGDKQQAADIGVHTQHAATYVSGYITDGHGRYVGVGVWGERAACSAISGSVLAPSR